MVLKPHEEFTTYQYKEYWIRNHEKNDLLNKRVDWRINMLWSEKVFFVENTMNEKYFDTEYYGWCDIGYFRCRSDDLSRDELTAWPSRDKIIGLNTTKVYYARVNNDNGYMSNLLRLIQNKNDKGVPLQPIPDYQVSIAGGFFITHKNNVTWWKNAYNNKLKLYFENNYLVKDDQIIVIDCILSDISKFWLCVEDDLRYDNWFLFQRYLL
jgi:hypothetical protein